VTAVEGVNSRQKNGSTARDNYMGARLLRREAAERVIDGLLISTATEITSQAHAADYWAQGCVVADEAHNAESSNPSPARPPFIADRRESALVVAYKAFLRDAGDTREQGRLKFAVKSLSSETFSGWETTESDVSGATATGPLRRHRHPRRGSRR